ncbi:MAG: hypothetical protein ACPG7U_01380 [Holosporaceae bacterium]
MKNAILFLFVVLSSIAFLGASPLKHLKVRIDGKNTTIGKCSYEELKKLNSLLHSKTIILLDPHVFTLKIGNTDKTLAQCSYAELLEHKNFLRKTYKNPLKSLIEAPEGSSKEAKKNFIKECKKIASSRENTPEALIDHYQTDEHTLKLLNDKMTRALFEAYYEGYWLFKNRNKKSKDYTKTSEKYAITMDNMTHPFIYWDKEKMTQYRRIYTGPAGLLMREAQILVSNIGKTLDMSKIKQSFMSNFSREKSEQSNEEEVDLSRTELKTLYAMNGYLTAAGRASKNSKAKKGGWAALGTSVLASVGLVTAAAAA